LFGRAIHLDTKTSIERSGKAPKTDQEVADNVLYLLFNASESNAGLRLDIQSAVSTSGWKESLAERILKGTQNALESGVPMGEAMAAAFKRSVQEAVGFVKEHPVYFTVIALGVLVVLAPWILEVLGFAELGPVEGNFLFKRA
jgi:hypothetical protein